jgi:hypothetical protein
MKEAANTSETSVNFTRLHLHTRRRENLKYHHDILTVIYWDDQVNEDEMRWACSVHGKDEKCVQNFGWKV